MKFINRRTLLAYLVALLLAACSPGNDFKAPIARFQESTETATAAIKTYYAALNEYERSLYLQERLLHDSLRVAIRDRQGNPTPLFFKPFSPEALEGRLDLLQQISLYGQQLAALAGNEAPAQAQKNLMTLSGDLSNLDATFKALSKNDDPEAARYIGPISTILGIVTNQLLEKKRTNALRQAIRQGQHPIDSLLTFLEEDLRKYVESTRTTGQRLELAEWVNYYNRHIGKLSFAERQQVLRHIEQAVAELELVQKSQPADVVTGLRKAHLALVQYAASSSKPGDLGSLVSAVKAFEKEARQLVEATIALRKLSSEK
jgi:hypothetical protein